jgi:hypothetical protein
MKIKGDKGVIGRSAIRPAMIPTADTTAMIAEKFDLRAASVYNIDTMQELA